MKTSQQFFEWCFEDEPKPKNTMQREVKGELGRLDPNEKLPAALPQASSHSFGIWMISIPIRQIDYRRVNEISSKTYISLNFPRHNKHCFDPIHSSITLLATAFLARKIDKSFNLTLKIHYCSPEIISWFLKKEVDHIKNWLLKILHWKYKQWFKENSKKIASLYFQQLPPNPTPGNRTRSRTLQMKDACNSSNNLLKSPQKPHHLTSRTK